MRTGTVKESERSEMVRDELRKNGFKIMWDVLDDATRVSFATDGKGKCVLLLEHAQVVKDERSWQSWDIYRPVTTSNKNSETFAALSAYTQEP